MNAPVNATAAAAPFSAQEMDTARAFAQTRLSSLPEALAELCGGRRTESLRRMAATAGGAWVSLAQIEPLRPAFERLPFSESLQRECLLLNTAPGGLALVVADPFDLQLQAWAGERAQAPMALWIAERGDILACLARHEDDQRAMDGLLEPARIDAARLEGTDISLRGIAEDENPVVRLVNSTLHDALKGAASDIHLESLNAGLVIKYRVDGVLAQVGTVQGRELAEQVISRIKVLAELDIAERRVPQDGRFKARASDREVDIRVSVMPSIHGEDAVLRILDKRRLADTVSGLRLDALGFDAPALRLLRQLASEPYGMLLVTGPTGSGKTTTLYAAINEIHTGHDKIITIEDPVEYELAGVLQIPVNEKKGLGFARGLRSILRHDPDKIMVGEIRDAETAQIAVQAALTGHLVLTTVHANNVFDALSRFAHMQIDPHSLVAALKGIAAQRLVRLLCEHCSYPVEPVELPPELRLAGPQGAVRLRASRGCASCRGTGFKGRRAVAEVLVLDDEMREAIVRRDPVRQLRELARRKGTRLMREVGLELVLSGQTSLQELQRVVA